MLKFGTAHRKHRRKATKDDSVCGLMCGACMWGIMMISKEEADDGHFIFQSNKTNKNQATRLGQIVVLERTTDTIAFFVDRRLNIAGSWIVGLLLGATTAEIENVEHLLAACYSSTQLTAAASI